MYFNDGSVLRQTLHEIEVLDYIDEASRRVISFL